MTARALTVEVECVGSGAAGAPPCPASGRCQTVQLREAAPGVVEVPSLYCAGCGRAAHTVTGWPMGVGAR